MKASELRGKTREALRQELEARLKEQFNLRMQQATGQLVRPSQLAVVRREIARIKTVLNDKARTGETS